MPDGSLFPEYGASKPWDSDFQDEINEQFPDTPPGVVPCSPNPGKAKKKAKKAPCPTATMLANLAACDGGTGVVAAATAANGGTAPTVGLGKSAIQSGGSVDSSTGTITIDPTPNCCSATQVLVQELANLSHKAAIQKAADDGAAGDLSREDFTKTNEKLEYDGVKQVLTAFDACKTTWGCAKGASSIHQWARSAKDFDDYYKHRLGNQHKNHYRHWWDGHYKTAYDAKHPPPAKKKKKGP